MDSVWLVRRSLSGFDARCIFGNDNIWQLLCLRHKQSDETTKVLIEQRLKEEKFFSCSSQSHGTALCGKLHLPHPRNYPHRGQRSRETEKCLPLESSSELGVRVCWVQLVVAGRVSRAQLNLLRTWHVACCTPLAKRRVEGGERQFRQPLKKQHLHEKQHTKAK